MIPLRPRIVLGTGKGETSMLDLYFKYKGVLRRLRSGALGGEMDRIAAQLTESGYKRASAKVYISRLSRFSDFAARHSLSTMIDQTVIDRFVDSLPPLQTSR